MHDAEVGFSELEDQRVVGCCDHLLIDIATKRIEYLSLICWPTIIRRRILRAGTNTSPFWSDRPPHATRHLRNSGQIGVHLYERIIYPCTFKGRIQLPGRRTTIIGAINVGTTIKGAATDQFCLWNPDNDVLEVVTVDVSRCGGSHERIGVIRCSDAAASFWVILFFPTSLSNTFARRSRASDAADGLESYSRTE